MLSAEQLFLLTVLSDHLNHRKTVIPKEIDREKLYQISLAQQVTSIFYYQTRFSKLKPFFASENYKALNRRTQLRKIHETFSEAGIPYLIFKGTEIAVYYPYPELRSMGDVDILVHCEDKKKAGKLLEKLGFCIKNGEKTPDHEWIYRKEYLEIELHHRLLYDATANESSHVAFTDKAWAHATAADGVRQHLETEFHFVFLLLHLRKHFLQTGIGIRLFLDLAVMMKNAQMDWKKVENYLSELGLCGFSEKCFGLIARWFGIAAPILLEQIPDEFYELSTNMILSESVFGQTEEEKNVDNAVVNTIHRRGKILPMLSILFPSYQWMKARYPGMAKSPLLLPILWVRRFVDSLLHKRAGKVLSYAAKHLVKSRNMKKREILLKKWDLL